MEKKQKGLMNLVLAKKLKKGLLSLSIICSLIAAVGVFSPTAVIKASDDNWTPVEWGTYRIYVYLQTLENGYWLTRGEFGIPSFYEDYGESFRLQLDNIDHTEYNARIVLAYEYELNSTWSGYTSYELYDYVDVFDDHYYSHNLQLDDTKSSYYFTQSAYISDFWRPFFTDISYSGTGATEYKAVLNVAVAKPSLILHEIQFNVHDLFQTNVGDEDIFVSYGTSYIFTKPYLPPVDTFEPPTVDLGDLGSLSGLKPEGALLSFFGMLFDNWYIVTGMGVTLVLGVLGFCLFGERKGN